MQTSTFIDPKFDLSFKKIFGSANSTDILISFLNAIMYAGEQRIVAVHISNPYVPGDGADDKLTIVDIQITLNTGEIMLVEMQRKRVNAFAQRILYNGAKRLGSQLKKGIYYDELVPVISIIVVDFEMVKDHPGPVSHFILREEKSGVPFSAHQFLHFFMVECPKAERSTDDLTEKSSQLDKWLVFLNEAGRLEEIPEPMANTPAINHAFELARRLNLQPTEREIIERRERDALMYEKTLEEREEEAREEGERIGIEKGERIGIEKGERIGIEKGERIGIEKGERIGIEKMIIRMLERGDLTPAEIASLVGLPLSEIQSIDEARI